MNLRNFIRLTVREFLNEQKLLKENETRYKLIPYSEEGIEDIDIYDAENEASKIAKNGGINILSDKSLSGILIDSDLIKVIGGVWVSNDDDTFSFDIAIDKEYQNKGLSKILIEYAISEYEDQKSIYDEMGTDLKMEVDVINPKLAKILQIHYKFKIINKLPGNRVIMTRD